MADSATDTNDPPEMPSASLSPASPSESPISSDILPSITTDLGSLPLEIDTSAPASQIPTPAVSSTPVNSVPNAPVTSAISISSVPLVPPQVATSSPIVTSLPSTLSTTTSIPASISSSIPSSVSISNIDTASTSSSTSKSTPLSSHSITTIINASTTITSTTINSPPSHLASTKNSLKLPDKVGLGIAGIFGSIFLVTIIWFLTGRFLERRKKNLAIVEAHASSEAFVLRQRQSGLELWKKGGPEADLTVLETEEPESPVKFRSSTKLETVAE